MEFVSLLLPACLRKIDPAVENGLGGAGAEGDLREGYAADWARDDGGLGQGSGGRDGEVTGSRLVWREHHQDW